MRKGLIVLSLFTLFPLPVQAETNFLQKYAKSCISHWENPDCLRMTSSVVLKMAEDYGRRLEKKRHSKSLPFLKSECAAATAATKGNYPADAMRSAFTACANGVFDLTETTKVLPEPISYQILIGAVLCLSGDNRCAAYEKQLQQ